MSRTGSWLVRVCAVAAVSATSCGDGSAPAGDGDGGSDTTASGGGPLRETGCPEASAFFPSSAEDPTKGECVPVGPQDPKYWPLLYDGADPWTVTGPGEGVPTEDELDCPKGTVPTFAETRGLADTPKCAPVGPQGCDPLFVDRESGLCSPEMDHCPEGSIPLFGPPAEEIAALAAAHGVAIGPCWDLDFDPWTGKGCGEGPWGDLDEEPGDVHVSPGADPDLADGTRAHPWPLIAQALGQVAAGGRIVLAKGVHPGGVKITKEVTLEGPCPSEVTVGGEGSKTVAVSGGPAALVYASASPGLVLRGLTLGGPGVGLAVTAGAQATVERVAVRQSHVLGLVVLGLGTEVEASGLLVEGTLPRESDQAFGRGIDIEAGARLVLGTTAFRGNRDTGLFADGVGTEVEASGLLVEGTLPRESDQIGGRGIEIAEGARLVLATAAVRGIRDTGLFATGEGTEVEASGLLVEGTLPRESDGARGVGLGVQRGAFLGLDVGLVRQSSMAGVMVFGASGDVAETLLDDTLQGAGGKLVGLGDGLVTSGAVDTVSRVLSRGAGEVGSSSTRPRGRFRGSWRSRTNTASSCREGRTRRARRCPSSSTSLSSSETGRSRPARSWRWTTRRTTRRGSWSRSKPQRPEVPHEDRRGLRTELEIEERLERASLAAEDALPTAFSVPFRSRAIRRARPE